ncbi:MAG: hypothetical protein ACI841_002371 [Planctomycetota bacterium]|jgi:hypothetical protein
MRYAQAKVDRTRDAARLILPLHPAPPRSRVAGHKLSVESLVRVTHAGAAPKPFPGVPGGRAELEQADAT